MAGYTRQSAAEIVANAVIKAAPVNAEYNALRDVFAFATGHKHDGSSTEGAYIPLIADVDALNKVVIDTTNNRIGFFSQVGSGTVEQLRIQDGAIVPVTDSDIDLGASGSEFKDLYIDGIGYIDTLTVHENATIAGTLGVTGLSTLASVDINGGNIDATVIGAATPAAATITTLVATTADINAGTVDATIGGTTPAAGTFTSVIAATADINAGTIDATTIGASTPATIVGTTITGTAFVGPIAGAVTGAVTGDVSGDLTGDSTGAHTGTVAGNVTGNLAGNVTSTGNNVLATVDIGGGTIDGTQIGATATSTIVGTTVTASNFVGPIAGAVTGNVTGNTAGVHTGAVTGNVTGNITAGSGTSSFTNVTINGSLNMNASTSATVTGLSNPVQGSDAATKTYVDAEVAAVLDSAPGALNTLNELAAALGDDANYASTTTAAIATKLPKAGGTMTGAIAMGNNKVTGLGAPTAGTDAAHKTYVDGVDALKLAKSGDTMSGVLAMGANKITGVANPTAAQDVVTKSYSDTLFGSTTAAATSASNAATSASNASTSETNAAASYDSFDDRYLGAKSSNPTVDNDGNALIVGSLHWNTTANTMRVWNGSIWKDAGSTVNGTSERVLFTATAGQTTFAVTYDAGFADVYLNGVKLLLATDYTATNGTSIVLASGATVGDSVDIVSYSAFVLTDHHTKTAADARFLGKAGGTMTGDTLHGDNVKAKFGTGGDLEIFHDGTHSYVSDVGTGPLRITSNGTGVLINKGTSESMGRFLTDGAVELFYDNALKIATTASGVNITGVATADGLTVDGISTLNNHVKVADGYSMGWGDITTRITGNSTSDIISAYTAGSERMRIDSSGKLLLGDSASHTSDLLQIETPASGGGHGIQIRRNDSNTDQAVGSITFGNNTATDLASISAKTDGATDSGALLFKTSVSGGVNTERVRIDAAGNALVGKSSQASSSSGCELLSNGTAQFTRDGNSGLRINRLTSDGELIRLSKAGTVVGSIGSTSGKLKVGSVDTQLIFADQFDEIYPSVNGATTLGDPGARFKDLYLSGGVFLGGTGAANKLDDYEEGTWTPNLRDSSGNSVGQSGQSGHYTKIGNLVYCIFAIQVNSVSGAGNALQIKDLPFTVENVSHGSAEPSSGELTYANNLTSKDLGGGIILRANNSTDYVECKYTSGGAQTGIGQTNWNTGDISSSTFLAGSFTYRTT